MLREAGYRQRHDRRDLVMTDHANDVEFFYLRPRDIAIYVGEGTLDVGLTGRDLVLDSRRAGRRSGCTLGFGGSTFRFAAPAGGPRVGRRPRGSPDRDVVRRVCSRTSSRSAASTRTSSGSTVRSRLRCGSAWPTRSPTSSRPATRCGRPASSSSASRSWRPRPCWSRRARATTDPAGFDVFVRRLQGVLVARSYVMMDYDIRVEQVEAACALTPGIESPTVSPLHREGWVAVRSMVPRDDAQRVMDELYDLGARGILVTDIHACRL